MDATVVMGQQGRLVIPAEVRAMLGLVPGDRLQLEVTVLRLKSSVVKSRGVATVDGQIAAEGEFMATVVDKDVAEK